jgi:hypothetical protein
LLDPTHAVWITQKRLFRIFSPSQNGSQLTNNH